MNYKQFCFLVIVVAIGIIVLLYLYRSFERNTRMDVFERMAEEIAGAETPEQARFGLEIVAKTMYGYGLANTDLGHSLFSFLSSFGSGIDKTVFYSFKRMVERRRFELICNNKSCKMSKCYLGLYEKATTLKEAKILINLTLKALEDENGKKVNEIPGYKKLLRDLQRVDNFLESHENEEKTLLRQLQ